MGQLQVFALAGAQNVKLVTYSGNQGNTWHSVQAFLRASQNYQVNAAIFSSDIYKLVYEN